MPFKKKGTVILTVLITICVFAFMGFRGFVNSIRDQRTCDWANIDNIELHAHIDVPKIVKWDCDYEKVSNTKRASFTIDKNSFDLNTYIQGYNLKKINHSTELEYGRFLNMKKDSLVGSDLYYKKSKPGGERYDVILDKETGRLWITIEYKD